jgi:20S proteasome subunit beta 6
MSEFNPYSDNGGTCVAIAGRGFAVIGADTRHSEGYLINTRTCSRLYPINSSCVLGTTSFFADGLKFFREVKSASAKYKHKTSMEICVSSLAQLVSNKLYSHRFFPYYTFNIIAGYDPKKQEGVVYSYDPVGSFQAEYQKVSGCGAAIIQPFLDSKVYDKHLIVRSTLIIP